MNQGRINPKAVFDHASRFHYAGALLRIEFQAISAPTIEPYVVVSSFCSELYMKCIYSMENDGRRIQGHSLRTLFDALSDEVRQELSTGWATVAGIYNDVYDKAGESFRLPTDLGGQLDASGRMFAEMRYFYEGGDFAKHWYLSPLPDLLRSLILRRQPDWADDAFLIQGTYTTDDVNEDAGEASAPLGRWSFVMYGIPNAMPYREKGSLARRVELVQKKRKRRTKKSSSRR